MTAGQPLPLEPAQRSATAEAGRVRLVFCLLSVVVVALVLLALTANLLQDPDSWWHLRTGLNMLETRTFPTVDTYSYTFAGHPWIAKEWLGQVFFALAYQGAGWNGVAFVTAAAVLLTAFLLCWLLSAELKPALAFGLTLLLIALVGGVFTARPHIFTLPIIVVWTALLFRAARADQAPPFWLLPLLWLWTNLHGTFTFGFVIAAFAGLDVLARNRLARPGLLAKWCLFGALCLLVSLLNPYGIKAILATFTVASGNEAVPLIAEWRPFNATDDVIHAAVLLLMIFGMLVSGLRVGWPRALFILFTLYLYLTHQRFIYVFFLLAPLILATDIAEQFPALSTRTWARGKRDSLESLFVGRFRSLSAVLAVAVVCCALVLVAGRAVEPSPKTSAKGALAFAARHGLSGPVLNSYGFGGTLIFHGIKTFIDGRTDQLFLNGFMQADDAMGSSAGRPILEASLEKYSINWALLSKDDSRIPFFDQLPGWNRVYSDPYAVIYARRRMSD